MNIAPVRSNLLRRSFYRLGWLVLSTLALATFLLGVPGQVADSTRGLMGMWLASDPRGRLVTSVVPGMPAEQAGIRAGELLTRVNGRSASAPLAVLIRPPRSSSPTEDAQAEAAAIPISLTVIGLDGQEREVTLFAAYPSDLPFGLPQRYFALFSAALDVFFVLAYLSLGTLIVWTMAGRCEDWQRQRFALLVALALLVTAVRIPPELYRLVDNVPGGQVLSTLLAGSGYVIFPLLLALFPNGRWVPRWLWLYPLFWFVYAVAINTLPGVLSSLGPWRGWIDMSVVGLGLLAQAYRYRFAATAVERQQTKWALYGILIAFVLYYGTQELINSGILPRTFPGLTRSLGTTYLYNLFTAQYWLSLLTFPVAMVFAILRYRLWEIDVLIRKTLVYTLITSLLALVYFGTVLLLEALLRWLSGTSSVLTIVLSTLAITLLFTPMRRAVQDLVDRRFYRPRYNATHALEGFTSVARDEVDLERISGEMMRVVEETMQPEGVTVWVRREVRET